MEISERVVARPNDARALETERLFRRTDRERDSAGRPGQHRDRNREVNGRFRSLGLWGLDVTEGF